MTGQTDIPALQPDAESISRTATMLRGTNAVLCSPLSRCRSTLALLRAASPDLPEPVFRDDLIEQGFGAWEGRPYAEIGAWNGLDLSAMAALRAPGGESFLDLVERVRDLIARESVRHAGDTIAVIAHAGVIRAAVTLALDMPPHRGLSLVIDPLSVTAISDHGAGGWAVDHVNRV